MFSSPKIEPLEREHSNVTSWSENTFRPSSQKTPRKLSFWALCRANGEYYQNTALFPLVEQFQRLLRFEVHDTPDAKLEKLAHALGQYRLPVEETVPLFAPFLALPVPEHRYPPLHLSPQRQRQKTLETLVAILLELAERQPVLFIVEDLHWSDPSTLELLNLILDQKVFQSC